MQITFDNFQKIKVIFSVVAVIIVGLSVYFTNSLADSMSKEEHQRIELWADATKLLATDVSGSDFQFALKVIENNHTIPVMLVDEMDEVLSYRNIRIAKRDTTKFMKERLEEMKRVHSPIMLDLGEGINQYLYYDDSLLLKRLAYYPYIQIGFVVAFFAVLFFFFYSAKRSEQNRLWVGLSKETAHQLGTPISSLMAWIEIIKDGTMPSEMVPEMEKDVLRLQMIAERFSKIGSVPELQKNSVDEVVSNTLEYMRKRTSSRIQLSMQVAEGKKLYAQLNPPLFAWVIENLVKNAVDAIAKEGKITIEIKNENKNVCVDVHDTGKGIPKSKFSTVFNPGFTTKKRGWGLGLSLVKRIVEEYHHGKIFVKKSEVGKGTTFRIQLKQC